jgi:hypothetical protein
MAQVIFGIFAGLFGLILAAIVLTVVLVPLFKGTRMADRAPPCVHRRREIRDALRLVGGDRDWRGAQFLLVVANILIFRWSSPSHFGRAIQRRGVAPCAASVYRILIGHPARLLCRSLVDGIENRVPQAVAAAPTFGASHRERTGLFENYRIVGSLATGGSGGKLYIAEAG